MVEIYWVEHPTFRVAVMPCPRGGDWLEEDIAGYRSAGVDVLVSLLEPAEVRMLELGQEESLAKAAGMEFISFPIPDFGTPDSKSGAATFIHRLAAFVKDRKGVAIHCKAGIGRSPTIAACALTAVGVPANQALEGLTLARGWPVPETREQRAWVERFAKGLP